MDVLGVPGCLRQAHPACHRLPNVNSRGLNYQVSVRTVKGLMPLCTLQSLE